MEICGKCMGTGVAGHPDSGYTCDCNGGMTDPTPTRAEVDRFGCDQLGMEKMPDGEWVRFTDYQALRERAEAAEELLAHMMQVQRCTVDAANEARRAEATAWNDAIEAARTVAITCFASGCDAHELDDDIRALRRAAPTEGEA